MWPVSNDADPIRSFDRAPHSAIAAKPADVVNPIRMVYSQRMNVWLRPLVFAVAPLLLAFVGCGGATSTTSSDIADNSCVYAFDQECDEGLLCPIGTDTTDCDAIEDPLFDGRNGTLYQGTLPPTNHIDNLFIQGAGTVGYDSQVQICVWDDGTYDGDIIALSVAGIDLVDRFDSPHIALGDFDSQRCWNLQLTTGYYYRVSIRAVNNGSISPNTGAIEVSTTGYVPDVTFWELSANTTAEASLVIYE